MTDEERDRVRELKAGVTARLAAAPLSRYRLRAVDRRLETYVKDVAAHPEKHNTWEQLSVEAFLRKCDRYGVNVGAVRAFIRFYESLTFPGLTGNQRYKLTPVQVFQYVNIFGFWQDGRRVVRDVLLFVPRKFSKTTSTASLAVWDLLFGDNNAECYIGANSSDQAKKCFKVIRDCVRALDPYERRFTVNEEVIKTNNRNRTALAQCLTANARTKDGLNASTIIMDEYSQARDAQLFNVLTTSTGARPNPLTVIITTASDVYEGPFFSKLKGYKRVLAGDVDDDSVFAHIFEPDPDDSESDPATWRKVHPHIGITVEPTYYPEQWSIAQREGAEALLAFRTKLLNLYAQNTARQWITRDTAARSMRPFDWGDFGAGCVANVGIDLSRVDDLTAVTTGILNLKTGRLFLKTDYFFPEGALEEHADRELFKRWAADGHLHLIPGTTIHYRPIFDHIVEAEKHLPLAKICYDSYSATDLSNQLKAYGYGPKMFAVPQSNGYFTGPVNALEMYIKDGRVLMNDNPITLWCFGNCVLSENNEGFKPAKRSASQKIDGVISMLMSVRGHLYTDY